MRRKGEMPIAGRSCEGMPSHQATLEITLALITIENVKGFLGALESGHFNLATHPKFVRERWIRHHSNGARPRRGWVAFSLCPHKQQHQQATLSLA